MGSIEELDGCLRGMYNSFDHIKTTPGWIVNSTELDVESAKTWCDQNQTLIKQKISVVNRQRINRV